MTNPCERGFNCPHKGKDEDGEYSLCLFPYTRWDAPLNQTFTIIECVDCPLEEDGDA